MCLQKQQNQKQRPNPIHVRRLSTQCLGDRMSSFPFLQQLRLRLPIWFEKKKKKQLESGQIEDIASLYLDYEEFKPEDIVLSLVHSQKPNRTCDSAMLASQLPKPWGRLFEQISVRFSILWGNTGSKKNKTTWVPKSTSIQRGHAKGQDLSTESQVGKPKPRQIETAQNLVDFFVSTRFNSVQRPFLWTLEELEGGSTPGRLNLWALGLLTSPPNSFS